MRECTIRFVPPEIPVANWLRNKWTAKRGGVALEEATFAIIKSNWAELVAIEIKVFKDHEIIS